MQITTSAVVIGCIIFIGVLTGCFSIMSAFVPSDPGSQMIYSNYTNIYDQFSNMQSSTNSITNTVSTVQPASGTLGIANGLLQNSYGAVKQIWSSLSIITVILSDLSNSFFGLPLWFTGTLTTVLLLTVGFGLLAVYFRWVF